MKEQISALIDGEANDLERERALRALTEDPALRGSWERYHLTRTVIRRELDFVAPASLCDRIHQAIDKEDMPARRHSLTPIAIKFLAGGAIAATVAAVAILQFPVDPSSSPAQFAKSTAPAGGSQTLAAEVRPVLPEQQRALNPYLVQHAEYAQSNSMNGLSGYARVVGRGNNGAE